jgi:2-iminobutanoate/2-iminopropanoate deaminase
MKNKTKYINSGVISKVAPYSDAIVLPRCSKYLFTSGTPGIDELGKIPSSFTEQAHYAWNNVIKAVHDGGMVIQDIVRVTHFLVSRDHLADYRAICEQKLGAHRPTSTLVFVAGLPWPEMLIEIQIDAIKLD